MCIRDSIIVMSAVTIPLSKTGFIARVINWSVTRKVLRGRPWLFMAFYFAAIYVIGCFLDVAACVLIALPVAKELCREIGYKDDEKFSSVMYMGLIWFAMWGYAATPIAHTVSIIIMGLVETYTGQAISMFDYMMVGIPSTIVLGVLSFLVLRFIVRPDVSKFVNYDPEQRAAKMNRKLSVGERNSVIIFCFVVLAILFPCLLYTSRGRGRAGRRAWRGPQWPRPRAAGPRCGRWLCRGRYCRPRG